MTSIKEIIVSFILIIPVVSGFYFILYRRWKHQQQNWIKSIDELGFTASSNGYVGNYRNHEVTIDLVDVEREGGGEAGNPNKKTRYWVTFKNPQRILLYVKKKLAIPFNRKSSVSEKFLKDIDIDNPFLSGLILKGNNENAIRSLLDADICIGIKSIKDYWYELEIGIGEQSDRYRSVDSLDKMEVYPNTLRYLDSQSFLDNKLKVDKFKLILDALINIVEKIEATTSSSDQIKGQ